MNEFSKLIGKSGWIENCIKKLCKTFIKIETGNQHNCKTPEASSFN